MLVHNQIETNFHIKDAILNPPPRASPLPPLSSRVVANAETFSTRLLVKKSIVGFELRAQGLLRGQGVSHQLVEAGPLGTGILPGLTGGMPPQARLHDGLQIKHLYLPSR